MANPPGRWQPFRFWYRTTPAARPPAPTPRPAGRTPLAPRRSAPPPASRRPPKQSPTSSRSPSPTQEASQPQKEEATPTQEVSHVPSLSAPPVSQPESPTRIPVEPEAQDSRPTVEGLSPATEQPQAEPPSRPEAQAQSQTEPAPHPPGPGNQTEQVSVPETVPVDTVIGTTPTQNLIPEREPKEIKEEKSVTSEEESKKELPPVEETKPQIDTDSKQDKEPSQLPTVEEKPQVGEELNIKTSEAPEVDGKSKIEPELKVETQPSQIPEEEEEKHVEVIEEKPTESEVMKKTEEPRSPKSETASEEKKNDESKTKPEARLAEKSTLPGDELSVTEPDTEAPGPHPDTSEARTKLGSSVRKINLNDTMGTRTIPWDSPSRGERASFRKEINEAISKLTQKLKLGQSQQLGSESAVSIITLAGENSGATMFLGHETTKKENGLHINKKDEASSGNKEIQKQMSNCTDGENPAITASINSNVQGINNSLLHDSSSSEEDAGVHLVLSIKPNEPAQ